MTKFDIEKFVADPSVDQLGESSLLKNDWISLAIHYGIPIKKYWKKAKISGEVLSSLVDKEVLDESAFDLIEEDEDNAIQLKLLEMEIKEREREREEKEREREEKERERE